MKRSTTGLMALAGAVALATAGLSAADQTWTGQISDSMCGAKHESELIGEGNGKLSDKACTLSCVKGGSKFVLVVGDKIYQITNQDDADLTKYAGETVKLTGDLKGEAITVSRIEK